MTHSEDSTPHSSGAKTRSGKREAKGKKRPTFDLVDAQWLRAQRSAIRGEVELKDFQDKLAEAAVNYQSSQGNSVGIAIVSTLGAIVVAILGVILGIFIMVLASDWISSMGEG
ncbi:hypothetical protein ACG98H_10430 [Corynebacterium sp. L4756]|uniref:hypothetical protein n=1 Tax=unclassified Corynebacterium TaxID=2624378 RepID=UPI00374D5753